MFNFGFLSRMKLEAFRGLGSQAFPGISLKRRTVSDARGLKFRGNLSHVHQRPLEVFRAVFVSSLMEMTSSLADIIKFQLRNRKHVPCFYRVTQTRVEVWENEKCCGNTSRRRVFPQLFRVLPNFHECFYNSIETRRTIFLFLLENNATRKRKTTC